METTVLLLTAVLLLSAAAQTKITAEVGQDVILPCEVPNKYNIKAVKWIRPDQDPEYVLFYRDGHFDPDYQNPSYQNRVDLQDKDMKDGDVSLILKNVTKNDSGRYECRVFEKGKKYHIIRITILEVHLSGEKFEGGKGRIIRDEGNQIGGDISRGRPGAVVPFLLVSLVVLASLGFLMYKRHMKKNPNLPVPRDEPTAEQIP